MSVGRRVGDSIQRFLQPRPECAADPQTPRSARARICSTLKGLCVAAAAFSFPLALAYLVIFTDGFATEEVEGFNYAGMVIIAFFGALIAPPIALALWIQLRKRRDYVTLVFTLPPAVLVAILTLRVLLGDCLDPTVAC